MTRSSEQRRSRSRRSRRARFSVLGAVLLVSACFPTYWDGPEPGKGPGWPVSILAYNVKHGEGMDGVVDLERTAARIREVNADLVALQEINQGCGRTEGVDQAATLGQLTGMHHAFGEFMDYDGGRYGMAVLSRWPILSVTNHRLPDGVEPRSALEILVETPGGAMRFVGIHLYCTGAERLAQARALLAAVRDSDEAVVLCGDFNSEPSDPVLAELATEFTPLDKGEDHFTFPSDVPAKEIDYVMVRPKDGFTVLHCDVLDEPLVSDHRPLFALIAWPNPRGKRGSP